MRVTNGLAALAATVAIEQVEREVTAQKGEVRAALADLHGNDTFARELRDRLVGEYKALSQPSQIAQRIQTRRSELTYALMGTTPSLPAPPTPPVRKDIWELVVVGHDRQKFDELMRLCERRTLQIVQLTRPDAELSTVDNLRDAHTLGFTSLMLESERYPDLCNWEQTRANIQADVARCERGWERDPQAWASECFTLRVGACAQVLSLSDTEFMRRMPEDLQQEWSHHHD